MSTEYSPPSTKAFHTKMREMMTQGDMAANPEVAYTVFTYVDLAKRMLLELRVRDFTATDVVALTKIMEARDRAYRIRSASQGDK